MGRIFIVAFVFLCLGGCATDKPLEGRRLDASAALEVVRYATPEIQRHSAGTITGGGLLFGGFGMEAVAASAGKALRERCKLQDFGALVVEEFVALAPDRVHGWPRMNIRRDPVETGYAAKDVSLLAFQPSAVWLYSFGPKGLTTNVMATLTAPNGEVIWRQQVAYSQKEAKRERELAELEANDCALLKEEMAHAAKVTATDLVAALTRQQ